MWVCSMLLLWPYNASFYVLTIKLWLISIRSPHSTLLEAGGTMNSAIYAHDCWKHKAQWSSSMIRASGVSSLLPPVGQYARGPGFNSRLGPFYFVYCCFGGDWSGRLCQRYLAALPSFSQFLHLVTCPDSPYSSQPYCRHSLRVFDSGCTCVLD